MLIQYNVSHFYSRLGTSVFENDVYISFCKIYISYVRSIRFDERVVWKTNPAHNYLLQQNMTHLAKLSQFISLFATEVYVY